MIPKPKHACSVQIKTAQIEEVTDIRGVPFPSDVPFRQVLITGPLGSGKTTLVEAIHGWSQEGYVDLARNNWWRSRLLSMRPREVHFGIPFVGHESVVYGAWPESPVDFDRIKIPPAKTKFYHTDWKSKFVFDIQLPPPELIYEGRQARAMKGSHPPDRHLTFENVKREYFAYMALAQHFQRNGLHVYIRDDYLGRPRRVLVDNSPIE